MRRAFRLQTTRSENALNVTRMCPQAESHLRATPSSRPTEVKLRLYKNNVLLNLWRSHTRYTFCMIENISLKFSSNNNLIHPFDICASFHLKYKNDIHNNAPIVLQFKNIFRYTLYDTT